MLKKSLVATALTGVFGAAALPAHAQSSVTLYGLIDAGILYTNNQGGHSNWVQSSSALQSTIWGLKGSEDLGSGLHAIFKLENGFNINNGANFNTNDGFGLQAYAGLQSDKYGMVTVGRQFDLVDDYLGPLSASGSGYGGNLAGHPFNNDNLAPDSMSVNNTIKFTSNTYYGVTVGGMYSFSNAAGSFSNNRAYGFGASYAQGPFNFAAAYFQMNNPGGGLLGTNPNTGAVALSDGSADFVAQRHRIWGVGGSYTFGAATVGLLWTHSQIDSMGSVFGGSAGYVPLGGGLRLNNYEVNGHYALTSALTLAAAYTYTDGSYNNGTSTSPKWNQVTLQSDYALSKRTDVYLEGVYQHVSGGGDGTALSGAFINGLGPSSNSKQIVGTVGIRHKF